MPRKTCLLANVWMIIIILSTLFLYCSCNNKDQQRQTEIPVPVHKDSLRRFILNAGSFSNSQSISRLDSILITAEKDSTVFHQTIDFLEKPLSDPNSKYRSEDLYMQVLKAVMRSPWYDSLGKIRPRHRLQLAMQNRPGEPANDFTYITTKGTRRKLYDLAADYTLLFFYNPECQACEDVKAVMKQSAIIDNSIATGQLKILAIYTDNDLTIWRRYLPEMPANWIMGHDQAGYLYAHDIYDVHAIPTIYLLDKNKNVLLKDCISLPVIERNLH